VLKESILKAVRCARCGESIDVTASDIVCSACEQRFPRLGPIPILLRDADTYLRSCRRQLALLEKHAARTIRAIEEQLKTRDLMPITRQRSRAVIDAVRTQAADIRAVLEPLVGQAEPETSAEEFPAPLQYVHYLYRDWGWPSEPEGENERALAMIEAVLDGQPLGHILVLGAGACRLAYDLHRRDADAETLVVDIDAFIFVTAHRVIRGDSITMREANAEVNEMNAVIKEWTLKAHHGPLNADRFHFLLADGLETPLVSEAFDTVVTPWLIDVVPSDLRNFISEVHRLLKPGGRWLNLGPLHYRLDVPVTRRFAREEVVDLAVRAGFRVDKWKTDSMPYLVSKLNGRGKVEWVLAFSATKLDGETEDIHGRPPAWLLFRHIPVPMFEGQSVFWTEDPAEQIVLSAIDGRNTLDDIASILASNAGDAGLTMDQFREIVRRCLVDIHPHCREPDLPQQ
jgi:SAM-dependent methyltransferase